MSTTVDINARPPRFERISTSNYELTSRDEAVILIIGKHRLIRSTHIIDLLKAADPATSEQQVKRRLRVLFDAGYISRPKIQLESYRAGAGSRPMVYMLGNKGAELLASKYGFRRAAVDWTSKSRSITRLSLDHALEVTEFMVALEVACARRGDLEVLYLEDILRELAPIKTQTNPRPYYWSVRVPSSRQWQGREARTLYVIPDKIFGIKNRNLPEGRNRKFFFLEADRGTMPVVRPDLDKSSLLRKLVTYAYTYADAIHRQVYGLPNFRVLTVVPTQERVNTVKAAHKQYTAKLMPDALCLLADRRSLFTAANILEYDWSDAGGQRRKLLD